MVVYHGSTQSRSMIQQYEMYYRDAKVGCGACYVEVLVVF